MYNPYSNNRKIKNNPRNPFSTLYRGLTRVFSGPIDNWKVQHPRRLKRWQLEKYKSKFESAQGQLFKQSTYNPFEYMYLRSMQNQNRTERYRDFNEMEYMPEIASALDIYADEMTTSSKLQPMLQVNCANQEIKEVCENLLYDTLNVEYNLYGWCRSTCKYGDFFLYLDIDEKFGITYAMGLPAEEVERLEGEDKTNPNYVQFQWNSAGLTLENWQVAHFRIQGNDKFTPYGVSVLDPSRRIFRQLDLLEQAMMAYRIVRSPERRVFYLDVAGIPSEKIEHYLEEQINQYKRRQIADEDQGRVDLRYKPEAVDMDFFIPVRGANSATRVETLQGGSYTGDVEDVKYLRDKLFTALKIPQEYLTNYAESGGGSDKATLSQKDVRFARTIGRLQQSITSELQKICATHLYILGYRGKDLLSFRITMNNPSKIAELQELEQWRTKFEVASQATESFFSRRSIGKNIFGLSDEEILQNQREMFYDRKMDALLENVVSESDVMGNLDNLQEPGEDGGESKSDEEDVTLLAKPGHRREKTTTPKSKGKLYSPVKTDKRDLGANKRSFIKQSGDSKAERGVRNVFPGYSSMRGLSSSFLNERFEELLLEMKEQFKDSNYKKDEPEIINIKQSEENNKLFESLDNMLKNGNNKNEV